VLGVQKTDAERPSGSFQYVFFLSEQAVHAAGELTFCAGAEVFAVGAQTAAQLAERSIKAALPARAASEGLIEQIAQLPVAGAACLIVAGEGGRKILREALSAAAATVTEYLCYRRIRLPVAAAHLVGVSHILVASQDGFRAMARLWCESGGDADVKVIAASDRIAALGPELGFLNLEVAAGAADADFIAALEAE
jgi:uroporphyrinogen-III synthase